MLCIHIQENTRYGLSEWETTLQCNVVSQRLSPYPEWSLHIRFTPNDLFEFNYDKRIGLKTCRTDLCLCLSVSGSEVYIMSYSSFCLTNDKHTDICEWFSLDYFQVFLQNPTTLLISNTMNWWHNFNNRYSYISMFISYSTSPCSFYIPAAWDQWQPRPPLTKRTAVLP